MNITVVDVTGKPKERIYDAGACQSLVFKDDYLPCANPASWAKGELRLCVPHSRLDEVEVAN